MNDPLVGLIKCDHKLIFILLEELKEAKLIDVKWDLFKRLKNELVDHMDSEEEFVYSKYVANPLKTKSEIEHHRIRELLQKLILFSFDTKKWWETFDELQRNVKIHCTQEEQELFPVLEQDFSEKDLNSMASDIERSRQHHLFSFH